MKLTAKHHLAINLLATGHNSKEAAEALGVTPEAVSRWKADFNFQAELNSMLEAAKDETQAKLRHLSGLALSTIEGIMLDDEAPCKERLTASLKILDIVNIKQPYIGSTDANVLKSEKEQSDLLESYNL